MRSELEESLEVLPEVGGSTGLKGQHIGPAVLFTDVQHGAAGEEGIARHTQAGLREVAFQGWGESSKGFEFAILFDGFVGG